MENFSYGSYADSGDSSPRSREVEFDSVAPGPPWDQNYRAKFMCSYGGKILPRPHDNSLCYVGGETKILAVDRAVKLATMAAKLSALFGGVDDVSFKYQLPGEDLDALISVTNDDDLELMMCEFDRLQRAGARPARMRLFMFPSYCGRGFAVDGLRLDRDVFVEALNLGPNVAMAVNGKAPNTVDFLFGLEKYVTPSAPPAPPPLHAVAAPAVTRAEHYPGLYPLDNYYAAAAAAAAKTVPARQVISGGFPAAVTAPRITEQPVYVIATSDGAGTVFHPPGGRAATPVSSLPYSAPVSSLVYSTPIPPPRTVHNFYREKQVYGMIPPPPPPPPLSAAVPAKILPVSNAPSVITAPPLPPPPPVFPVYSCSGSPVNAPPQMPKMSGATYADTVAGIVRTSGGFDAVSYGPIAYENGTPRHVYYAAPGGGVVVAPPIMAAPMPALPHSFAPVTAVGAPAVSRGGGGMGLDGKLVVGKVKGQL